MVEQPSRACVPCGRPSGVSPEQEAQADPERAPGGPGRPRRGKVGAVGAVQRIQVLGIPPNEVRRDRQYLEILGPELGEPIAAGQRAVRLGPGPEPVVLAPSGEVAGQVLHGRVLREASKVSPGALQVTDDERYGEAWVNRGEIDMHPVSFVRTRGGRLSRGRETRNPPAHSHEVRRWQRSCWSSAATSPGKTRPSRCSSTCRSGSPGSTGSPSQGSSRARPRHWSQGKGGARHAQDRLRRPVCGGEGPRGWLRDRRGQGPRGRRRDCPRLPHLRKDGAVEVRPVRVM